MIFLNLPAETLIRIESTCHAFVEAAAYVLRTRMPHAFNIPELNLLFKFGAPDTYLESVKCEYLGIRGLNDPLQSQQMLADAFAVFHPTPYSPAEMPVGGSADESLGLEVAFENSEKFVQFMGNLSLVLTLATAFIADGTKIGGKMVIRLQRDWLEKESSKLISLDHEDTIRILIEARKTEANAEAAFAIRISGKTEPSQVMLNRADYL
ncbi:hypothetical protein PEBR_23510 [Penicillium brasilianum]|uniref:Uncharacterized protein n=1 Tax=Penicillium brasilianum TaxID=104259 RepID=A0A1S9RKX0_PENBI|nr:hypothetical protein PEBR_23510 [Penicillium brasilianum]